MKLVGTIISKLHTKDIVHGDLTTSNFLYLQNESPAQVVNSELHEFMLHVNLQLKFEKLLSSGLYNAL